MKTRGFLLLAGTILTALSVQNSFSQCNTIDAVTTASFKITGGEACSTYANLDWSYNRSNGEMDIEWGTSTSYGSKTNVYASKPIKLTNLTPNTTYYYHVWGIWKGATHEYTKSTFKTSAAAVVANKAPEITSAATAACTSGTTSTYTITATDADNDQVTFTVSGQPSWATFATPKITLKPTNTSQNSTITIVASDGKGGTDTLKLAVTVVPSTGVLSRSAGYAPLTIRIGSERFYLPRSSVNEPVTISLFTLSGSRMLSRTITISGSKGALALPKEITAGVYLVQLQSSMASQTATINLHR